MHQFRHVWLVAVLTACSGASGGNASPGATPATPVADAPPAPADAQQAPLADIQLSCELTKSDGACNQAKAKSMSVTVDSVNTCNISAASKELTVSVESSAPGGRDSIRVRVPNYPNAAGSYAIDGQNAIGLTDADVGEASNGVAPHGAGFECSNACTVGVQETTPGGVRNLALDVSCKELCIANDCLRCKPSAGGDVKFTLAVACP